MAKAKNSLTKKILIVDNDPEHSKMISMLFKRSLGPNDSIMVKCVNTYDEASSLISEKKFDYDIISLNGFWPGLHAGYAYNFIPLIKKRSGSCVTMLISTKETHLKKARELGAIAINKKAINDEVKFNEKFELVPVHKVPRILNFFKKMIPSLG